jgi:hypothetical protein
MSITFAEPRKSHSANKFALVPVHVDGRHVADASYGRNPDGTLRRAGFIPDGSDIPFGVEDAAARYMTTHRELLESLLPLTDLSAFANKLNQIDPFKVWRRSFNLPADPDRERAKESLNGPAKEADCGVRIRAEHGTIVFRVTYKTPEGGSTAPQPFSFLEYVWSPAGFEQFAAILKERLRDDGAAVFLSE